MLLLYSKHPQATGTHFLVGRLRLEHISKATHPLRNRVKATSLPSSSHWLPINQKSTGASWGA